MIFRVLLISFISVFAADDYKLEFSQIVWRHGDRAPVFTYPNNPDNSFWKQGLGQLTQLGMEQHYELGEYFRERYNGFISPHYFHQQIYIYSSDEDRLIQSALSNMAGWFPPSDWQVFENGLNWQPIPVHITGLIQDSLQVKWVQCKVWMEINQTVTSSPEYIAKVNEARPMMAYIASHTGVEVNFFMNFGSFADLFLCEKAHNLTLPQWFLEGVNYDQLQAFSHYCQVNQFYTEEEQVIAGGPLFKIIRDNIANITKGYPTVAENIIIYSGHDTTIIQLAMLMGVYNNLPVPYAAALLIEIYSDVDNDLYIKLSYRNESHVDPFVLRMPTCGFQEYCPVDSYLDLTKNKVMSLQELNSICEF